ncbi:MAG TPA: pitrilysin family protein [Thermoanaerobaculia bacterium]|nr:pitrilysin family protein [Thermoanaerobaculia bacterium]
MKTKTVLAALSAALTVAPALLSQNPPTPAGGAAAAKAKQAPPAPAEPKNFALPAGRTFRLDNGLAVTLVPYGTIPKVTVRLGVRTGNIDEKANEVWLSDLTGSMLTEGTATRTATQIAEEAARMGGSIDVNVTDDRTDVGGDVLSEFGPDMVALVADVVRNPKLPDAELTRLKGDRLRDLSIAKSQPRLLAQEKFRAVLYGDHPYGRLFPTEAMLQGYTAAQVRDFWNRNYGAARSHLYVVGRFDDAAVEAAVRKAFGDWKKGVPPAEKPAAPKSERAVYLIDRPGAVQSTINLGMPVIDPSNPDWDALALTNTLLGGSFASRITANIREQKGYTYSPNSQVLSRRRDAYWVEVADVTTNVTGPSIKEIFGEIDRLQAEPPAQAELRGFQNYRAGTFVLQNSSRPGIIGQLEFVDLNGLPADYLNGYVKRVYAIKPQQIQEMAKKYIQDDKATIVVVGDRKVIEEQVKAFGSMK